MQLQPRSLVSSAARRGSGTRLQHLGKLGDGLRVRDDPLGGVVRGEVLRPRGEERDPAGVQELDAAGDDVPRAQPPDEPPQRHVQVAGRVAGEE